METSSVDNGLLVLLSKNFFLCPKILLLLFKAGADLRMDSFSVMSLRANGFTFLTTSYLML